MANESDNQTNQSGRRGQSNPVNCSGAEEAASECARELAVRQRCYARWVTEGRLTQVDARDRLFRMARAVQILNDIASTQQQDSELREALDEVAADAQSKGLARA